MKNAASKPAKKGLKAAMQSFGTKLSGMVLPNIGAFIAWGLITAIFLKDGWFPNADLAKLIDPMKNYLLPLLIAYSGGAAVAKHRGGVVGAIATMGVIVGTSVPMFIGAMVMGPLGGWCIKKWDDAVQPRIRQGFEMLVNNFSAGIIGMILAILGFFMMGPIISAFTNVMAAGVNWMISHSLLWLANIFIEPAKILFLNNAINQGILTPLGIQQAAGAAGKSILFLLEPDPGPGLGVLLAFAMFGKGAAKGSAPSAIIIHFFGGIHEIYFPYILMKPALFLSVIAGGVTGTTLFSILGVGLKSSPSPGSIISLLLMSPKDPMNYLGLIIGVTGATVVSFLISAVILKRDHSEDGDLAAASDQMAAMKAEAKGQDVAAAKTLMTDIKGVNHIIFACDAGMGSSAMGASILRDKVKKAGLDLSVTNTAISNLQDEPGLLVVTQEELADRAQKSTPSAMHVAVANFLNSPKYDEIIAGLKTEAVADTDTKAPTATASAATPQAPLDYAAVKQVVFMHHDQNVGSATMAQATFKSELHKLNKTVAVANLAVGEVEDSRSVMIIASKETARRLRLQFANVQLYVVDGLLNAASYDDLIEQLP